MKVLMFALMLQIPISREPVISLYQLLSPNKSKVVVSFDVPNSKLVFKKLGQEYKAQVELRISVYDRKKELLYDDYWVYSNDVRSYSLSKSTEEGLSRSVLVSLPRIDRARFYIRLVDRNADEIVSLDTLIDLYGHGLSDLIPLSLDDFREGRKKILLVGRGIDIDTLLLYFQVDSIFAGSTCAWTLERSYRRKKPEILLRGEKALSSYEDTLLVSLSGLTNGDYVLRASVGKEERTFRFRRQALWSLDDKNYRRLIGSLVYIAEPEELKKLREAPPGEREKLWNEFWEKRDPTPGTPYNEVKEEYLERVAYANEHFSLGRWPGYKTDRGRIYILLGPPDEIEDHPFDVDAYPYQIWYYHTKRLALIFVDQSGAGDYVLVYPPYDFNFEF